MKEGEGRGKEDRFSRVVSGVTGGGGWIGRGVSSRSSRGEMAVQGYREME